MTDSKARKKINVLDRKYSPDDEAFLTMNTVKTRYDARSACAERAEK